MALSTTGKVVIGVGVLCVLCCGGPLAILGIQEATMTPEEKAARAAAKEAELDAGKAVEAGLVALAGREAEFNPLTWSDVQACDTTSLRVRLGENGEKNLLLTDFSQLEELSRRVAGEKDYTADESYFGELRQVRLPSSFSSSLGYDPSDSDYRRLGGFPLVGVFVDLEAIEPTTFDDETFEGGYYDGYLVIVDSLTQERLCWKRFLAENSEVVEFEDGFSEERSMKKAIDRDFEKNFKAAIEGLDMSPAIETKTGIF
ncbi:MAG: hypothetical protein ACI9VR_000075 [Cognaticolwellia sp.]|jgi:hypothetical protein